MPVSIQLFFCSADIFLPGINSLFKQFLLPREIATVSTCIPIYSCWHTFQALKRLNTTLRHQLPDSRIHENGGERNTRLRVNFTVVFVRVVRLTLGTPTVALPGK